MVVKLCPIGEQDVFLYRFHVVILDHTAQLEKVCYTNWQKRALVAKMCSQLWRLIFAIMERKKTIEEKIALRYVTQDYIFSRIEKLNDSGMLIQIPEQISEVVDDLYNAIIEEYFPTEILGIIGQNEFSFAKFKKAVLHEARPHILSYLENKNKAKELQILKI